MALGETNDTASMCLNPAPISARRYWTLTAGGIWPLRPCQASRGHSMILISFAINQKSTTETQRLIHHGGTETRRTAGHRTFRTIPDLKIGTLKFMMKPTGFFSNFM